MKRGFAHIIAALGALPGTPAEIVSRIDDPPTPETVYTWMRSFERLGVVHVAEQRHVGRATFEPVFVFGEGKRWPWPRKWRRAPGAIVIGLASVFRALVVPMTVRDLAEETGLDRRELSRALVLMRAAGLAHVGAWHPTVNVWAPAWVIGPGADARRPAPQSRKVVNARAWAARRERRRQAQLQQALAGVARGVIYG